MKYQILVFFNSQAMMYSEFFRLRFQVSPAIHRDRDRDRVSEMDRNRLTFSSISSKVNKNSFGIS